MPEPTPPPTQQPGSTPQPAQPPVGSSPATGPTQNRGFDVAAVKMAGMGLKVFEMVIPLAGSSSPLGQSVMKALREVGAHVPPGSVTPADMQQMIQQLIMRQQQFGKNMQMMRQQQPGAQQAPAQAAPSPQPAPAQAA